MVTIYPPSRLIHSRQGGVASYSKNIVNSILKYCSAVIFAEKLSISEDDDYSSVPVYRCWTKGVKYPFQIFKALLKNKTDLVHIQYETYLYGGLASALVFPLLLALIRLQGMPVIVTMHGVVPLSKVNKFFLKENQIPNSTLLMRLGLTSLVKIIVSLSTAIIVHEKNLKAVLINEYNCPACKINVIHHGIEKSNVSITSSDAKKKLGVRSKKVILFFGYITGYKNLGLLIDSAKFLKIENWIMIIAGGVHPRLKDDESYLTCLSNLRKRASKIAQQNILFTGFVPEDKIPSYFLAADLVVFPYSICMSSSGPMSLAASYGKPFLVADSFREIIDYDDITFINEPKNLAEKIDCFFTNPKFRLESIRWVNKFKMNRSWAKVAEKTFLLYMNLIETSKH